MCQHFKVSRWHWAGDTQDQSLRQLHIRGKVGNGCHTHLYVVYLQTNGTSNGLVPMLRVFNNTARYVDQGGNKRPGAFAIYLEPWHADVFDFLELRKNHGSEEKVRRQHSHTSTCV